jgi:hypothetical protein
MVIFTKKFPLLRCRGEKEDCPAAFSGLETGKAFPQSLPTTG